MSEYWTLERTWTERALELLRRADEYRRRDLESYARGCERKALKKFELSFALRNWPFP